MALLGLTVSSALFAKCTFVDVPPSVKSDAMLLGNVQVGKHLHAAPMTGSISFKCDADTAYSLVVDGGGSSETDVAMISGTGTRIPSRLKVLTIGNAKAVPVAISGRQLTQTFSGLAEKDKTVKVSFEVLFDDLPVQLRDNARKDFMGRMHFTLNY